MNVLAAVVEKPGVISLQEFPRPTIGPDAALLKVEMGGICSTDVKILHGAFPSPYPIIMGHENLGWIEEIGEAASRRFGVKAGDRVVVESSIPCGTCFYCLTGGYRFCQDALSYGTRVSCAQPPHLWGGYAQYMYLAPRTAGIYKISPRVPAEVAVLITTVIANGIQWLRRLGGAQIGDTAVIVGAGPQALGCVAAARESGVGQIIVLGLAVDRKRLELAREMGASRTVNVEAEDAVEVVRSATGGRMADVVVEVSGSPAGVAQAIDLARKQGTVVLGGLTGTKTLTQVPVDKVVLNEVRLQGAFSKGTEAIRAAIQIAEELKYPFEKLVTDRFRLSEAEKAVKSVGRELPGANPIKVVLLPDR
jgi:alcohol dehydrogenase